MGSLLRRPRRARIALVLGLAGALASTLAGCLDAEVATPAPTPTRQPDPTPTTTSYQLDASAWYEGMVVRIDVVTATLDARGGPVEVHLRIDNPTSEPGELDGRITLVVDGTTVEATRESQVPVVPAQGTAGTVLTYELQGIASIDGAMLQIGAAPLHVARIPITPAAGAATTLEPIALTLKGSGAAGTMRLALRTGLIRWDLPDWSQELDAKLEALIVTYDVTYAGDFPGGFAFTGDNIALRLPDGTIVESRPDGHSQSIELIGPNKTKKNLFARFEIPSGTTGAFAILARNGKSLKVIPFTIKG